MRTIEYLDSNGVKDYFNIYDISFAGNKNKVSFKSSDAFPNLNGVVKLNKDNSYFYIFIGSEIIRTIDNHDNSQSIILEYKMKFCSKYESIANAKYHKYLRDHKINQIIN